jgi:hypothetical protein
VISIVAWLRDLEPYVTTFMNVCVCCNNRCHGNAVNGFWALHLVFGTLRDIYEYVCLHTLVLRALRVAQ